MAVLQKARITTFFGLPKEVYEDADVTKNRCGKQTDETSGVAFQNKGSEDRSCTSSYSGTIADEEEDFAAPRGKLQQSKTRGKQVVNLFGGLLGLDVCKRNSSRTEGRSAARAPREAQDHCRPGQKDGYSSDIPSCSVDGCPPPSTIESTQERESAGTLAHQDRTRGAWTNTIMPLADTQVQLCGAPSCATTSHRQSLLSFDNKGRLVVESSPCQQQPFIPSGTSGTQAPVEDQGDGLDTQTTVSTKQQEIEKDEVFGSADQRWGHKRRRRKARSGDEGNAIMDPPSKEHRKVSKENLFIIKDQQVGEEREEQEFNEVTLKRGEGRRKGMVSFQRRRAGKGKGVAYVDGEGSGEEGIKESDRPGDEANCVIVDEVATVHGNRKGNMKRNVDMDKNVFVNGDTGELMQCCASNRSDQTLSRRKERDVLADRDSSRLMLSRKRNRHHGKMEVRQADSEGKSTKRPFSKEKGLLEVTIEEGTHEVAIEDEVTIEEGILEVAIEEETQESCIEEVSDKVKRKRTMIQPVDIQVKDQIDKMDTDNEHRTDKPKMSQRKHLNEEVLPQRNPHCCVESVHGGSMKNKGHHQGNRTRYEPDGHHHGNRARHEPDVAHHHGNRTRCAPDKARKAKAFLDVSSSSSDEEWDGSCTTLVNPKQGEGPASEATPLCGSWAAIFKKPFALNQTDPRSSDVPRVVSTPLNSARSGIFNMQATTIDLQGEGSVVKSHVVHQLSAASSPALQVPSSSPAPCWIRSPYQDSPSTFSPSPLHPPSCGKYTITTTLDHSPFSRVVHVQQRSPDEPFWHLELPHSESKLPHCPNTAPVAPRGSLSRTEIPLSNPVPPSLKICDTVEQERLLSEREHSDPTSTIRALVARYTTLTYTIGGDKASMEVLNTHPTKEASTKKRSHKEQVSHDELIVAIRVLHAKKVNSLPRKIVVDGSAYRGLHKKSLRLSKSRHKFGVENGAESLVEITKTLLPSSCGPAPPSSGCESSLPYSSSDMWSERYQPVKTSEVLGNTAQVQELYQWMTKWKERATAQRDSLVAGSDVASTKPPCSKPAAAGRARTDSDDDDFVVATSRRSHTSRRATSSDSEWDNMAEGGSLCPVALLCGPHGSGKTAAVLACAQELGFKIFVIDSTTLRSRQNILSVLREATLSHQVTKQLSTTTEQHSAQPIVVAKPTKPSRTVANNLLSFFKPQEAITSTASCANRTRRGKHKRGGMEEECPSKGKPPVPPSVPDPMLPPPQSSEVALVVATVIVLEEVDILFEDEKGFWSAIYEIIASTKRPIVMTSNAELSLDCDHMKITFCPPPPDELANHIEALCLVHGTMLPHEKAKQLAIYLGCDMRKVLNTLQYWLSSLPHQGQEVSGDAKDSLAETVASVSVEQLLGLSYQQASLLNHTLCSSTQVVSNGVTSSHSSTASLLSEALLLVHSGQLGVNLCMNHDDMQRNSDQSNTSCKHTRRALGNRITSHSQLAPEGVAKSPSHLMSFPWRVQQKTSKQFRPPGCLDLVSDFLDTMSDVDVLDPWGAPGGAAHPWWVTESGGARWPHATPSEQDVSSGVTATMEGLALAAVASHDLQSTSCCHDYYGLLRSPGHERHCEAVHSGQMLCCEVFDAQTELCRRALVVDCLPALHLLCQSESTREAASTQRRFRHYLQSSTVDIVHLKSFAKSATLHTTPDRLTCTHSLP